MTRLEAAEVLIRGTRDRGAVALWTGCRLGVIDADAGPELFAGLLDSQATEQIRLARGGYIAGRAGMTPTEVLDQLDRERHEAVSRMAGIGLKKAQGSFDQYNRNQKVDAV